MNVLAEFIGGSMVPGNAIAMCYFKAYGVETSLSALYFAKDLKLAHYTHIKPRHTFITQLVATLISSFVCSSIYNFIMGFDGICTEDAAFKLSCPGENTFYTAAVFWGTASLFFLLSLTADQSQARLWPRIALQDASHRLPGRYCRHPHRLRPHQVLP